MSALRRVSMCCVALGFAVCHAGLAAAAELDEQVLLGLHCSGAQLIVDREAAGGPIVEADFHCTAVLDDQFRQLASLRRLKRLRLGGCPVSDSVVETIAGLTTLEVLDLEKTALTDDHLAHLKGLKNLRELNLADCSRLHDEAAEYIARFAALEELDLGGCSRLTDTALTHLAALKNLRLLDLRETQVTSGGMPALATHRRLQTLSLAGCSLEGDLAQALSELTELESLDLAFTRINDERLRALAGMKKLKRLNLEGTLVSDTGLAALGGLPLESIELSRTRVTRASLGELSRWPKLRRVSLEHLRPPSIPANGAALAPAAVDFPIAEPDRARQLQLAQRMLDASRFAEAAGLCDRLLADSQALPAGQSLVYSPPTPGSAVRLVQTAAEQLLGRLPAAGRELYRVQVAPQARQALHEAIAAGSDEALRRVAARFFHTAAGAEATYLLGERCLARGDWALAAVHYSRLRRYSNDAERLEPALSLRLVTCLRHSQMATAEAAVRNDLSTRFAGQSIVVAGQRRPFATLDETLATLAGLRCEQAGGLSPVVLAAIAPRHPPTKETLLSDLLTARGDATASPYLAVPLPTVNGAVVVVERVGETQCLAFDAQLGARGGQWLIMLPHEATSARAALVNPGVTIANPPPRPQVAMPVRRGDRFPPYPQKGYSGK